VGDDASELDSVALDFDERAAKLALFRAFRECFLQQSAEPVLLALNPDDVLNLLPSARARSRVSLSRVSKPTSYSRTLKYPGILQRALRSGHYVVIGNRRTPNMTKYRRVVVSRYGGPEVLEVVEDALPEPQRGEVRVKILAAGVSFADVLMREGVHPETARPPFSLGWELVGVVEKLGPGVSGHRPGDRVTALSVRGSYAEYLCVTAGDLVPVPIGLDPVEVACMAFIHLTAYQMMHRAVRVNAGDRVLIHSAGGPVGAALLQLGALFELEMYGTASQRKHDLVSRLRGTPIDYKAVDFVDEILRLTGDGVDVVFDGIGGNHILRSYKALRRKGAVVAFGHATSLIRDGRLAGGRRSRVRGLPTLAGQILRSRLIPDGRKVVPYSIQMLKRRHSDWYREDMTALFALLSGGKLSPIIAKRLGLDEAVRAHELLVEGSLMGRIMLVMG